MEFPSHTYSTLYVTSGNKVYCYNLSYFMITPFAKAKTKNSCIQVSDVKKIRVGRSKKIFLFWIFFITNVQTF